MLSLSFTSRLAIQYLGTFFLIIGLIGNVIQVFTLTTVPYYRNTPCTFYFAIASMHECGVFMTVIAPVVVASWWNIDVTSVSAAWCKVRYFFASSFAVIPVTCLCLATIDQFLITSQKLRLRQLSNIKSARRITFCFGILWWCHGTLWLHFQEMLPSTGACGYNSNIFYAYAIFFIFMIVGIIHAVIMTTFGILACRNIKRINILARLRLDRQLMILVFIQIALTLIGLSPYGIYNLYEISTKNEEKSIDRKNIEAFVSNFTYLLGSLTYGGRFYLFLLTSRRFRLMVKTRIFWRQQRRRLGPQAH